MLLRIPRFFATQLQKIQGRFLYLFVVLVSVLVLYPYVGQALDESNFLRILWAIIPLTAVHACGTNRRLLIVAIVFALLIMLSMLLGIGRPVGVMLHISAFLAVLFYIFIAVVLVNHVWRAKQVDADMLYGGISVYLLLGIIWAALYREMEILSPGSFAGPDDSLGFSNFIYFSYVTLTTLGYGDILPVTQKARSLAILEAITGIVFLGTLIARLVSLYTTRDDER